jgi:hypothetical protein
MISILCLKRSRTEEPWRCGSSLTKMTEVAVAAPPVAGRKVSCLGRKAAQAEGLAKMAEVLAVAPAAEMLAMAKVRKKCQTPRSRSRNRIEARERRAPKSNQGRRNPASAFLGRFDIRTFWIVCGYVGIVAGSAALHLAVLWALEGRVEFGIAKHIALAISLPGCIIATLLYTFWVFGK